MSFVEDVKSRLKITEDGTLVDNDDLRRLLGIAQEVELWGDEIPCDIMASIQHQRVIDVSRALHRNDMHALDALIDPPSRQEVNP